jgi:pantoate--beta-alanine ligase
MFRHLRPRLRPPTSSLSSRRGSGIQFGVHELHKTFVGEFVAKKRTYSNEAARETRRLGPQRPRPEPRNPASPWLDRPNYDFPEFIPDTSIGVLKTVKQLRDWRDLQYHRDAVVGLVPTMGAFHRGHLDLARAAARDCDEVIVSLYVNPLQFAEHEDLDKYPRTWETDCAALAALSAELASAGARGRISAVFAPASDAVMYPTGVPGRRQDGLGSFVTITPASSVLEGASRPIFFRGVATVCMKLFCAVQPARAYFGQKDVQQTVVVRKMVRDFLVPTEIVVQPTAREADGLAMSSRNVYLGTRRRAVAPVLSHALRAGMAQYNKGRLERKDILGNAEGIIAAIQAEEESKPKEARVRFEIDYISLSDPETMMEIEEVDPSKGAILSGAVKMLPLERINEDEDVGHEGGPLVRLIDNLILPPKAKDNVS